MREEEIVHLLRRTLASRIVLAINTIQHHDHSHIIIIHKNNKQVIAEISDR